VFGYGPGEREIHGVANERVYLKGGLLFLHDHASLGVEKYMVAVSVLA
jgi:hypothetical protein